MRQSIVVVGGGIAGVSAAYALANHPDKPEVTVIEAEGSLAYHTTGRSAAQLILDYGAPPVRALSRASHSFLAAPPAGLTDAPLLEARAQLTVATAGDDPEAQNQAIDELLADACRSGTDVEEIDLEAALAVAPLLRPERFHRAALDRSSADIDVAGLHQAFVRGLRAVGGSIALDRRLESATRVDGRWQIRCVGSQTGSAADTITADTITADTIINAAGAWGDVVAERCGVEPVGLTPMRRTAFMVNSRWAAEGIDSSRWPLVADAVHSWYTKADGSQFLCSPADEIPDSPHDVKPEEIDIAMAIDRLNEATTLQIRSVASSWAGLRTFSPDRSMVIGPDPAQPAFHWCVGQGGTGIQTARAAGQLVADLALDGNVGDLFADHPLELPKLLPDRFRTSA